MATTKKPKTKPAKIPARHKVPAGPTSPVPGPPPAPVAAVVPAPATTTIPPAAAKPATPTKRAARLHRATLTRAGLRGRDLVRFMRLHARRPYGKRGEEAIRRLAIEVGHLGNLELNASAPVAEK